MKKDPLERAVKMQEAEELVKSLLRGCLHPHVHFQNAGRKIRCVDCKRFWLAGWKHPNGLETDVADYTYQNPEIMDHEFRHSPNEAPRRAPLKKIR